MTWWRRLTGGRAMDAQLDAEVRDHINRQAVELIAAGIEASEARRRALLMFGAVESIKEDCRDVRGTRWLEEFGTDVRYAVRLLRNSPVFTMVAICSLALGIGANVAVVSLVDAVLLRSLPVPAPGQLVLLAERQPERQTLSWSRSQFLEFSTSDAFSGLCAFRPRLDFSIAASGRVDLVPGQLVSGNCFEVLGVRAAIGRMLTREDDEAGEAHPVAVISHGFWQRYFGGDPAALGSTLQIKGRTFTIVGVTMREFLGLEPGRPLDVTIPLSLQPLVMAGPALASPSVRWVRLIGRLRPEVMRDRAAVDLQRIWHTFAATQGQPPARQSRLEVLPGAQGLNDLREQFAVPLRILMSAVALVLLVACANLGSLMLARVRTRDHEIGLRLALGAGRGRVVRQMLTESLVLSSAGGVAGLALAAWCRQAIVAMLSRGRAPLALPAALDVRLLAFTFIVIVAAGLAFGLWPAIWGTRRALPAQLRRATRTTSSSGGLAGAALIALQTTMSAVLLTGTVLFARTLANLHGIDLGFDKAQVLLFNIGPPVNGNNDGEREHLNRSLYARLEALPGMRSVTTTMDVPLGGTSYTAAVAVFPAAGAIRDEADQVTYNFVGPRFLETFRIPLISGRDFQSTDDERSRPVAIASESLAARYFPAGGAVGGRLRAGNDVVEIVGIAKDVPYTGLRAPKERVLYRPYFQQPRRIGQTFAIRTELPPAVAVDLVRSALRDVAPGVPLGDVTMLDARVDAAMPSERLLAGISGFFGGTALLLVVIGVYGALAYAISRRTRELGIRLALGASRGEVMRMMLRSALAPVCVGLAAGVPLALCTSQFTRGLLFGIAPREPAAYATTIAILLSAALVAAFVPARRAVRLDPVAALRET